MINHKHNMTKMFKLSIAFMLSMLIICILLIIMPYYLCRYDKNNDGIDDEILFTNLIYIIHEYDLDYDGTFDLKEYCHFSTKGTEKIVILNKKFKDAKVNLYWHNILQCEITSTNPCNNKPMWDKKEISIDHDVLRYVISIRDV